MVSEDILKEKNKRLSKKKGLVSEDIYWEKKRLLQTKDSGEWGHTFGMKKKSLEMVSEDILLREKQKTIKEKGSGKWGHLWRKKKTTTNKR